LKSGESIRKLNDGLNLIEKQTDEAKRNLEKVVSAEIKLRKQSDQEFDDRLQSYNEKFTYAMSSFQSVLGNFNAKLVEQKELVNLMNEFKIKYLICFYFSSLFREGIMMIWRRNAKKYELTLTRIQLRLRI